MVDRDGYLAVDYAALVISRMGSRFKLAVIGEGTQAAAVQKLKTDNVRVLPLQPAADLPRLLAAADALLLSQRRNVVDSVVPSKLLTYLASGRPVIAAVNEASPAARIMRESDCGLLVPPENASALESALESLAGDEEARVAHGRRGRDYAAQHYERGAVLRQWDRLVADIVANHGRG